MPDIPSTNTTINALTKQDANTPKLLKGGRVVNPQFNYDGRLDLLINNGQIEKIAENILQEDLPFNTAVINLSENTWVTPGLVDVHVHFRDPGNPEKETTATGAESALAGGFTTVCVMPNTQPVLDSVDWVKYVLEQAEKTGIQIFPVAAVTKGLAGKAITEMALLSQAGAVAFSDDGRPVYDANIMRRALEYSNVYKTPIVCHAEDFALFGDGVMHEGLHATKLGLPGIPPIAESVLVARDIEIIRYTGGWVHFAHISSKESVALIRWAKSQGLPVSAETTPHYLALTDACCSDYNADTRMNGPIREEADQDALWGGLIDGTIDIIATDHAPHTPGEKALPFDCSPNGVIGLETSLAVMLTHGFHTQKLSALQCIEKLASKPAQLFNLNQSGSLEVGKRADITLIDPNQQWEVDVTQIKSRSKNTPFIGHRFTGKAIAAIAAGKVYCFN
ncbi:MAG: dihydroorotase [Cyanobacteria bacterium P01_H01_bin.74]